MPDIPAHKSRIPVRLPDCGVVTVVPNAFQGTTIIEVKDVVTVAWLKKASLIDDAHFAMMDVLTPARREFGMESDFVPYGDRIMFTTHLLRHWLPDVFWGMVLGPPYVKLFGLERLLSAPAWNVEQIGEHIV